LMKAFEQRQIKITLNLPKPFELRAIVRRAMNRVEISSSERIVTLLWKMYSNSQTLLLSRFHVPFLSSP